MRFIVIVIPQIPRFNLQVRLNKGECCFWQHWLLHPSIASLREIIKLWQTWYKTGIHCILSARHFNYSVLSRLYSQWWLQVFLHHYVLSALTAYWRILIGATFGKKHHVYHISFMFSFRFHCKLFEYNITINYLRDAKSSSWMRWFIRLRLNVKFNIGTYGAFFSRSSQSMVDESRLVRLPLGYCHSVFLSLDVLPLQVEIFTNLFTNHSLQQYYFHQWPCTALLFTRDCSYILYLYCMRLLFELSGLHLMISWLTMSVRKISICFLFPFFPSYLIACTLYK